VKLERRKVRIILQLIQYAHSILFFLKDASGDEPEDLLFINPNHGIIPDDESDDDDEIGQPKSLGSDPSSELNEASVSVPLAAVK
jgi:hypothetical protein